MVNTGLYSDADKLKQNERQRDIETQMQEIANRFSEVDGDGDQKLDFEEFFALQPAAIRNNHTAEEIRQWFDEADGNGDGVLSVNEFFVWALNSASASQGAKALEAAFKEYDKDGSGMLDFTEFNKVATKMGFGTSAHCIFKSLDHDNSGEISYMELIESFNTAPPKNTEVKQLCTSLMFAFKEETTSTASCAPRLDTSGWTIKGRDVQTIRRELQSLLRDSGAHVGEVMALFDQDQHGKQEIDDMEFSKAMREHCGYKGPIGLLFATFKSLDTDSSGTIGFDELFEFIRGRRHSLDKRSKPKQVMRLQPPEGAEYSLDDLMWDCETLRILMMQMLERCNANPYDLLAQFQHSKSNDGVLDKREFLSMMRSMLNGHERLWEMTVRAVADAAFEEIDVKARSLIPGSLDLVEISRWLAAPTLRPQHLELVTQPKPAQAPPKKQKRAQATRQAAEGSQTLKSSPAKPGQVKSSPVPPAEMRREQQGGKAEEHKVVAIDPTAQGYGHLH